MTQNCIKPCPFCGEVPKLRYIGGDIKKWVIDCTNYKCKIQPSTDYHRLKYIIIREWNNRAY